MEIGSSKICKSKGLVFAHFLSKSENSSSDWWKTVQILKEKYSHQIFAKNALIPVRSDIFHFGPIASNILSRASFGKAHQLALVVGPGCTGGCHPGCENHCQFVNLKRKNIEEEALAWIKLLYCNLQYWIALILIGWVIGWFWAHGKRR